jgi:hypothetical protein
MPGLRIARLTVLASVAAALACALPAHAFASDTLQTSLIDDQQLIYYSPHRAIADLKQLKALGVDTVKVSVVWSLIAPAASSRARPSFDATDPGQYPSGAWSRYDRVAREAQQLGLGLYFMFVPPVPAWAIPHGEPTNQGERLGLAPDASDFGQFVKAAGRRYSGSYGDLPRVDNWGIWNEPDLSSWLNPWHRGSQALQPIEYRGLVNAAWNGLEASGHSPSTDTILIGELANSGYLSPLQFVRGLYCVGSNMQPLSGGAANRFGCPRSGSAASFVAANPGLFQVSGFAHHPYSFNAPPNRPYYLSNWITMYNIGSLERELNGIFSTYGALPGGGQVPMYLTEFGYESNPPNPYVKNSTAQQAAWINQVEYMAWKLPYVRSINQFELIDSRPRTQYPRGSRSYWGSFMTGLEFWGGKPKPALNAFRLPLWLPNAQHGPSVTVWGQLRPADHTQPQYGLLEFEPAGAGTFQPLSVVETLSPEGFFQTQVPIPSAGVLQLAWLSPSGTAYYSRAAPVS